MATKNKTNTGDDKILRWRFDVNTFRLLGRELITDRVTAVFELVKNCYDANATSVTVDLQNVSSKNKEDRKIIISDNGTGMSFADIRDKWMVVGTNSKRTKQYSDPPFNRKLVGEKGVGRFAVDKLGERLVIHTKQVYSEKIIDGKKEIEGENWLDVIINWDEYEAKSIASTKGNQLSLFTEVDNIYSFQQGKKEEHGTDLIISNVSEEWSELDIIRLYNELAKLVSPFYPLNPPFDIFLNSNDVSAYTNKPVKPDPIKFFSHFQEIDFDLEKGEQESLVFDEAKGEIKKKMIPIKKFGPVKFKIYFFNQAAKRRFGSAYKNSDERIDGVKIYRDGVITTPFAEYNSHPDYKKDILGIDKRLWRDIFSKVGSREVIGVLDITKENNPDIIDATNRQDFVDNAAYKELKEFIIQQLDVFGSVKKYEKDTKRSVVEKELIQAGLEVKTFSATLRKVEQLVIDQKPEVKEAFDALKAQASQLRNAITQSISEQKKFEKDVERKERILRSLVSMQEFASMIAHAVRTSIAKVKHLGEFFKLNFPNKEFEEFYPVYATQIYHEMNTLLKVTEFMLSYASADKHYEDFNVKDLLNELLTKAYDTIFKNENIEFQIDIKNDFILNTNKQAFQDVFQNLVSNSIKALRNTKDKKIKCSGYLDAENFTIYFSDNGVGIDKGDEDWIFGLFNTRTADIGGAGLGLYIAETQIKSLHGTIKVVESEFKPTGATFKITLPFTKTISNE
ncbi:MAG: sensor histidine kinase [Chitinophagales bacterium]